MPFITARVISVVRTDAIAASAFSGPDQSSICETVVQLQGTITGDDPANHTFEWVQTAGPGVTLINANTLTPFFLNPQGADKEFTLYVDRNTPFEASDVVVISSTPTTITRGGLYGNKDTRPVRTSVGSLAASASSAAMQVETTINVAFKTAPYPYNYPPDATYSPIYKAEDLVRIKDNLSGNYWLMRDIDLSEYDNWNPIGTATRPFSGELQGNGFKIENLTIISTTKDAGIFSYIGNGALIEKVGITNATISGVGSSIYKGILAGQASADVTVRDCYVEGTVASGGDKAGGLIGHTGTNASSIYENTYADVTVTGGGTDTGGWAGTFSATPTYIRNYGNTTKTAAIVGTGAPTATEVDGRNETDLGLIQGYINWDFDTTWVAPQDGISFNDVKLLMHMDGADSGTTFIDSSLTANTMTATGATTSTNQIQFGTASYYGNALGDGVSDGGDILTDNQSSFTIEAFVYILGDPFIGVSIAPGGGGNTIVAQPANGSNGDNYFYVDGAGALGWYRGGRCFNPGTPFGNNVGLLTSAGEINDNQWYHVAVTYDTLTSTARLFIDGTNLVTDSSSVGLTQGGWPNLVDNTNMLAFTVGDEYVPTYSGYRQSMNGYIDELRVTQACRYTEDFTVPTEAYPESGSNELRFATLQNNIFDRVASGGACLTTGLPQAATWKMPAIVYGGNSGPMRRHTELEFRGLFIQDQNPTTLGWENKRFIPREQNAALLTPGRRHRGFTVFAKGPFNQFKGPPGREVTYQIPEVIVPNENGPAESGGTTPFFGPYGGTRGAFVPTPNITIINPRKISKLIEDGTFAGVYGSIIGKTDLNVLIRSSGIIMSTESIENPGVYGNGEIRAIIGSISITRAYGGTIG